MHGNKGEVYKGGYKRRFSDLATQTQARYFLNEENHRLHKTDISDISTMIPTLLFLALLASISTTVSSRKPTWTLPGLQIRFAQGGIDRGKCDHEWPKPTVDMTLYISLDDF